jgi:hypothetical protein
MDEEAGALSMGGESTHANRPYPPSFPPGGGLRKENPYHHVLEHEKHDDERNIDTAHGPDHPADGPQNRFCRLVEEELYAGERRTGLHPKPTQQCRGQHDEPEVQLDKDSS